MSANPTRRLLLGGLAPLLAGCGFRPLNGPRPEAGPEAASDLAAVRVGFVANRQGQLIRQALQRRLERGGGVAARYELRVGLQASNTLGAFRRDGSPFRVNQTYTAPWSLVTLAVPPVTVASGTATVFDAYNVPGNEYFAAIQSSSAAERRMMEQLAEDIVTRLTVVLSERRPA